MLRLISALATALFLAMAVTARTAGALGFALLMIVVCGTVAVFAFAAARIDTMGKHHVYVPTPDEAALLRSRAQRQREEHERKARGAAPVAAPPAASQPAPDDAGD